MAVSLDEIDVKLLTELERDASRSNVELARQDEAAHRRFVQVVEQTPQVISADWVTGETDALLMIVARDVAELQLVLSRLTTRGGAQRVITLLRLEELKPSSPLPLRATSGQRRR